MKCNGCPLTSLSALATVSFPVHLCSRFVSDPKCDSLGIARIEGFVWHLQFEVIREKQYDYVSLLCVGDELESLKLKQLTEAILGRRAEVFIEEKVVPSKTVTTEARQVTLPNCFEISPTSRVKFVSQQNRTNELNSEIQATFSWCL